MAHAPEPLPRVAIIGTGIYGRSLARRFAWAGVSVVFGSRSAGSCRREQGSECGPCPTLCEKSPLFIDGFPVERPCTAVARSDVIILAVPLAAHCSVAKCIARELETAKTPLGHKIIIDISNAPIDRTDRKRQVPPVGIAGVASHISAPATTFVEKGGAVYVSLNTEDPNRSMDDMCPSACLDQEGSPCVVDIEDCDACGECETRPPALSNASIAAPSPPVVVARPGGGCCGGPGCTKNPTHEDPEESNAERLQRLMPRGVSVVKAFNTVAAYVIQLQPGECHDDRVLICGDSREAKARVSALIAAVGMRAVDAGSLRMARDVEAMPLRFFRGGWRTAFAVSLVMFVLVSVYVGVRDVLFSRRPHWADLFLLKFNVAVGWHAIAMMSATFAGGLVAAARQLWTGTAKEAFPAWLDNWLRARKAMGLLGLTSALMHACASLATDSLFTNFAYLGTHPGQAYQVSMMFAIFAVTVFCVLGVTSIPSVGSTLSWKEWQFIQSKLGHFGVALAATHALSMGYAVGDFGIHNAISHWPKGMPPASVIAGGIACVVVAWRVLFAVPFIASRIDKIRSSA